MRCRIGRPLLITDMESELRLDNARREENEQLLLGHCLRLILEQPAQHRHSGQIRNPLHVVPLRINEDATDHHGFSVSDDHLRRRFSPVNAWASWITPRTDGIASRTHTH